MLWEIFRPILTRLVRRGLSCRGPTLVSILVTTWPVSSLHSGMFGFSRSRFVLKLRGMTWKLSKIGQKITVKSILTVTEKHSMSTTILSLQRNMCGEVWRIKFMHSRVSPDPLQPNKTPLCIAFYSLFCLMLTFGRKEEHFQTIVTLYNFIIPIRHTSLHCILVCFTFVL